MARSLGRDLAVEIVITNYNYGDFVAGAIKSAWVQSHPLVRVIVVDDGSTDSSRDVLRRYANKVELVLKENGGQASAINAGIARCRGDVVMLLDADDLLRPDVASRVAAAFAADSSVVKVQSPMGVIDAEGRVTGETKPLRHMPLPNGDMRKAELTFPFDLPWVPTSGNAFRIDALRTILPIPETDYPTCGGEQYLIHLAALLGPVASLREIGAFYRVHGRNQYEVPSTRLDLDHLRLAVTHARATTRGLTQLADRLGLDRPARILSTADLGNRMTCWRLEPHAHPVPNESTGRLLADAIRAIHRRFDISLTMKCALVGWFVLSAVSPRPVVRWLGELFHVPEKTRAITLKVGRTHGRVVVN
jgi:hypothetical protein